MAKIERFEDIEAWQLARELCKKLHKTIIATNLYNDYGLKNLEP